MNKKKLLFIVNVDWFFLSHRVPIALKAIEQGYEVHLLCAITDNADYLEQLGLIVHPFSFSRSGKNIITELLCITNLYRQLKHIKPDLLHLVTIKPVLYGGIVARLAKVPSVVSAISGLGFLFVERDGMKARVFRCAILFLYRLAMGHSNQRVIFQNPTDMNALLVAGGVQKDKVRMICGSGVDLNRYTMSPEKAGVPVVIMASRLLKDKGVLEFVEAARIIRGKGLDVHFQLIGEPDPGNPESVSTKLVSSWAESGVVKCLGFRSDVEGLFSRAHIVVLPSYYGEGLPKVLIEAAACGRAIITTDMPGCRDAIEPNVSGILVPVQDVVSLVKAIEYLVGKKKLRQQMGRAGRSLAEREYSIDKVISAHFDVYHELEVNKR